MPSPLNIGIIGCGAIMPAYIHGSKPYSNIKIVACADLDVARAKARAQEFGIPKACTVDELIADPGIGLVLNLTVPKAHAPVNTQALAAGKHVYTEKPFAVTVPEGRAVLDAAARRQLRTGSAPDTFLGGGVQTARKLIDDGAIGQPVAATAFMCGHGHESWHPSPEFYYEKGGGPMFDMGPYYLTALVNLLGPVRRVTGSTRISFPERTITSQPKHGKKVTVETPTHLAGVMDFANGTVATIIQSFDIWAHHLPIIEIHGAEASLTVPDPNGFGGPVTIRRPGDKEWQTMPHTHRTDTARGIGVADMARGIQSGRPHRANGEVAFHVLDIMAAFEAASTSGRHVTLSSTCTRPAPLPAGLALGDLD